MVFLCIEVLSLFVVIRVASILNVYVASDFHFWILRCHFGIFGVKVCVTVLFRSRPKVSKLDF